MSTNGPRLRLFSLFAVLSIVLTTLAVVPVQVAAAEQEPVAADDLLTSSLRFQAEETSTEETDQAPSEAESPASEPAPQADSPSIDNFVFLDLDADGVRDAGEAGLAGVTVSLRNGSGQVLATTQTNGNGRYIFNADDGVSPGANYGVSFDPSTNTTAIPGGFFNRDLTANDQSHVAGQRLDAGLTIPFDVALRLSVDPSSINHSARTVEFTITVINQGRSIDGFQVINYLDYDNAGVWADFVAGLNPTASAGGRTWSWNASNPQRPIVNVSGTLAQGEQVRIPFIARWNSVLPADAATLSNWAEVINFDDGDPSTGNAASGDLSDHDSTPNRLAGDDAQPAGPGSSTDDEIRNVGGDEDDHDVAGLGVFDLALTKQLDSGENIEAVVPGSEVTYTITVVNQGLVDARNVVITDYVPAAMRLTDPSWTMVDGKAIYRIPGAIAPGDSYSVDISLQLNNAASGRIDNWAEISSATPTSGGRNIIDPATGQIARDIDSTADDIFGNDARPSGPGASTDDAIDGQSGDEDDHDVASVRIGFFDLAVSTTVTGGYEIGEVPIGNAAQFNIEVINQGEVNATDISLINYLPDSGLVLVDPDWEDLGNGTAVLKNPVPGPIAPGASVVVPITFLVDAEATGTIYNWAEIAGADSDGDTATRAPVDIDSRPANNARYGPGETLAGFEPEPAFESESEAATDESDEETSSDEEPEQVEEEPEEPQIPSGVVPIRRDEDDHDVAGVRIDPPVFDLSLYMELHEDIEVDEVGIEDEVTFVATILNEGNVFVDDIELVDYLPDDGLVLADSDWAAADEGLATYILESPLPPGGTVEVEITFVVTPGAVGTINNTMEIAGAVPVDFFEEAIRGENGQILTDIDSVPYGDKAGNVPGTEDDHAIAAIHFEAPPIFDLAIFSDLANGSERSLYAPGDVVSYDITVLNQGEVIAEQIHIETNVPVGFGLYGRDWEVDNQRLASLIIDGPLAPGESKTIEVTFRADDGAAGDLENPVWIEGSLSVDTDSASMLGIDGVELPDVDPSDDQTKVDLSVIPTLAFADVQVKWGEFFGWAMLALATFAAMIWLRFRGDVGRSRTVRLSPAMSRWG